MRRLLAFLFVAVLAACGSSPQRFSDGSVAGTMSPGQMSNVTIDGKPMRLAPGARILTTSNTSITPDHLPPNSRVRYKLDASGQVSQVWLLPPEK